MWKLLIETLFDLWEIHFDQVWSSLIHFGQIRSKKIKNRTAIFILFVNVATFYSNIFWLARNPIWSSLIKFDPFWTDLIQKNQKSNSHFYPFCKCDNFFIVTFFDWREIQFDQVWSTLINFGQIWSEKIWNKTAIVILFVNVATFNSNIFWLVRNPIWSSSIKFDPFWTNLILKKSK